MIYIFFDQKLIRDYWKNTLNVC